jgi:hypothetical protein
MSNAAKQEIVEHSNNAAPVATLQSQPDTFMRLFERLATDPTIPLDRIEKLLDMQRDLEDRKAKDAYMASMALAQGEIKAVVADKDNKQTKSRYASYTALDDMVRPIYSKHGFALSYDTEDSEKPDHVRIVADCSNAGHTRRHHVDMPCDGKGAKGGDVMTKTHAFKGAVSYGKGILLTMIFNIPISDKSDDDGNSAGAIDASIITDAQADELRQIALSVKADMDRFCNFFRVESLVDLPSREFDRAKKMLGAKRQHREAAHAD